MKKMNQNEKGPPSRQLGCEICEIDCMSNAEYALHEFSKKHCDNLIRSAKNKPILKKQKIKNKIPEVGKETVKINTVTHTGSFAKYGYFIPGEIYVTADDPKEFNSDYDPYRQKFAETSFKDKAMPSVMEEFQQQFITVSPPAANISKKKKKKQNNIKMCQICNVTLLTTPLYEAHMKSPEHIFKLKISGMGVSAQFVKASSDLHTIQTKEDEKISQNSVSINDKSSSEDSSPSLLHSKTSELALSSSHQFASHGTDWFKKNVEEKEMLETPLSDKLFCYTCNILLNTVFQYNEHKHGRKHKMKCRALIRKGMTIPLEERVPGIDIPNNNSSQPVYPELYKKMILERQKSVQTELCIKSNNISSVLNLTEETEPCGQNKRLNDVTENSGGNIVTTEVKGEINGTTKVLENTSDHELVKRPKTTFHSVNFVPAKTSENSAPEPNSEKNSMPNEVFCKNNASDVKDINKEQKTNITVLNFNESLHCSICNENFQWQCQFDTHLTHEDHFKKIVELKVSGKSDLDILSLIFSDKNIVKPNNLGKLVCGICKVTADNKTEFEQHLNCIVHKYSEKDYKQKRTLEVKHLIPCDETGMYYCKLCKIKLASLVEYSRHLFSAKHKSIQKKNRIVRSVRVYQRQRFSQNLNRKYPLLQSLKTDKKLDFKTKGSSMTTDLCTGAQSKELLDAKIEPTQNVNVELNIKSDTLEAKNKLESKVRKRHNLFKAGYKVHQGLKLSNLGPTPQFLPFRDFRDFHPPTNFSRFPNRPPYRRYPSSVRNVPALSNSHPPGFGPIYERPSMNNPFYRPPCFERAPWRNYR